MNIKEFLISHFEKKGRKNPKGHAGVHCGCWVTFLKNSWKIPTTHFNQYIKRVR